MSAVTSEMRINSDRVVHLTTNESLSTCSYRVGSTTDGVQLHSCTSLYLPHCTHTTPTCTDRQLAADALHRAFLVNFIADLESRELDYSSDSEGDDSNDSMDGSSSSSDSSAMSSPSESSKKEGREGKKEPTRMRNNFACHII